MVNRSKNIGTAAETAAIRWAIPRGFPGAERSALAGNADRGDGKLCPGVGVEVKAGKAAETASPAQVAAWLIETETERVNGRYDVMLLVAKVAGKGPASAGAWHCYLLGWQYAYLAEAGHLIAGAQAAECYRHDYGDSFQGAGDGAPHVRLSYDAALIMLRRAGYGSAL